MKIKLTFLGAAGSVTGSRYLLEADGTRLLVDAGLCQERDCKNRDWEPFPVPPGSIDAVLLTHAHVDHTGLLPRLAKDGFHGLVYCTEATADIAKIILLDTGKLQEEDAEFKKKRHEREGRKGAHPEIPLYTMQDAEAVFPQLSPVKYGKKFEVHKGIEAIFYEAGHVLGSANVKMTFKARGWQRSILFSGDVGYAHRPILRDPATGLEADYVLVESTYGNRPSEPAEEIEPRLAEIINATVRAGGNIVIPSFALERSQDILYHLNNLLLQDRIPHLMVFLDSPMAVNLTEVFEKHSELWDEEMRQMVQQQHSPFRFLDLRLVRTIDESKAINYIKGTVVIIAGSGMCTGGRIKHHLVANISRPESTILFVGFQAVGTLGRIIVDGAERVRILGQWYQVRAKIMQLAGLSAHANRDQLLQWVQNLQRRPRRLFVIHGEPEAANSFADLIKEKTGWNVTVPNYLDEVVLE